MQKHHRWQASAGFPRSSSQVCAVQISNMLATYSSRGKRQSLPNNILGVATRTVKLLLFLFAFLISAFSAPAIAAPKLSGNYFKLILGQWLGPRKIEFYHADGTWGVRRNEEAPEGKDQRRWSIKANKLTITYPGDHGIDSGTFTIISLTSQELILDADGYKQRYERFTQKSK